MTKQVQRFSKYLRLQPYLGVLSRVFNRQILSRIEGLMGRAGSDSMSHPPIFIIGAPRSGSTLATQVIVDNFDLAYLSNLHCRYFGAPALAERFFRPRKNRPRSDYQSRYGATRQSFEPAECGQWWYRFFRRNPAYVTLDDIDPAKMREFRRSLLQLSEECDRPVLLKNLYASVRLQPILHYLPESLFIVIHRDEVQNAHSLLEARWDNYESYDHWFSVEPPEMEQLKTLPAHAQVIEQIRATYRLIDKDFSEANFPSSRRFDLNYEALCASPAMVLAELRDFLSNNNCAPQLAESTPERFHLRNEVRIDAEVYKAMVAYADGGAS